MTAKQLAILVLAMSVLAAGLAWGLQRLELRSFHDEILGYLKSHDRFRAWESEQGPAS